jgi:DNA-binding GntR family transcriptional regulator
MDPTRGSARPLREQIADKLRQLITDGELQPGDRLSPEEVLAEQYKVSRHTIRQALQDLTAEGLLMASRGRGRIVRAYKPLTWHISRYESRHHHEEAGDSGEDQWSVDVRAQGREPRQDVKVEIVEPPEHVAALLGVGPDELVVVRRRVRYVDEVPYQLADSYFRASLVQGTPLMQPRDVYAPGGVLASLGHIQTRYVDDLVVRMPTKQEATRLGLPQGTPVAELTRTGYDKDDVPLRVMVTIAPGDRHRFRWELDPT